MRAAPNPAPALRAVPHAAPGPVARVVGRAGPTLSALAPRRRSRAGQLLAAGSALSALGHAALAFWLVQTPTLPPPDGPDVPATEVSLLSGAQFAALTAPPPDLPKVIDPVLQPLPDKAVPTALPKDLAVTTPALRPVATAPPRAEGAPDVAALTEAPTDPEVAVLLPELTAPHPSPTGVPVARPAPDPVAQAAPPPPEVPDRADARPVAPDAAPALPNPAPKPRAPKPTAVAPTAAKEPAAQRPVAQKPAAQAGDGGAAETTRARSAGSADARDGWLAAIRARVERRKAYPAAAGGAEGRVTLQLTVDRAGRLKALGVVRSSGNPTLDAAALRAVKSAGRFPKAPGAVTEAAVTFNLPLRFSAGT